MARSWRTGRIATVGGSVDFSSIVLVKDALALLLIVLAFGESLPEVSPAPNAALAEPVRG